MIQLKPRNNRLREKIDTGKIVLLTELRGPVSSVRKPMSELQGSADLVNEDCRGVAVKSPTFKNVLI